MDNLEFSPEKIKAQKKKYFASFLWKLTLALVCIIVLQFLIYIPLMIIGGVFTELFTNPSYSLAGIFDPAVSEKVISSIFSSLRLIMLALTDGAGALILFLLTKKNMKAPAKRNMPFGYWVVAFLICFGFGGIFMIVGKIVESFMLLPGTLIKSVFSIPLTGDVTGVVESIVYADNSWLYFFVQVLVAAVLVPIIEEIIFRKLIIDNTSRYGYGAAVMISAFTFAVFHGNFTQFFYAFALGMIFAYVYAFTGKLRYTIFFHICYNMYSSFVISFANRLLPEGVLERLTDSVSKMTDAIKNNPDMAVQAYNRYLADIESFIKIPGFLLGITALFVVRVFLLLLVITGIVLFLVFIGKAVKFRRNMPMGEKGTKRCAAFNYGAILFYVFGVLAFGSYYLIANLSILATMFIK